MNAKFCNLSWYYSLIYSCKSLSSVNRVNLTFVVKFETLGSTGRLENNRSTYFRNWSIIIESPCALSGKQLTLFTWVNTENYFRNDGHPRKSSFAAAQLRRMMFRVRELRVVFITRNRRCYTNIAIMAAVIPRDSSSGHDLVGWTTSKRKSRSITSYFSNSDDSFDPNADSTK